MASRRAAFSGNKLTSLIATFSSLLLKRKADSYAESTSTYCLCSCVDHRRVTRHSGTSLIVQKSRKLVNSWCNYFMKYYSFQWTWTTYLHTCRSLRLLLILCSCSLCWKLQIGLFVTHLITTVNASISLTTYDNPVKVTPSLNHQLVSTAITIHHSSPLPLLFHFQT